MTSSDRDTGLLNDEFRKTSKDLVRVMLNPNIPSFSPIFDLIDKVAWAAKRFEFPEQETGPRNQGEVNVDGHVFKWEIGYAENARDAPSPERTSETQRQVLTVYFPGA